MSKQNKHGYISKVIKSPILVTLSTFAALWIAIILQWSRSKVEFEMLIAAVGFTFLVVCFMVVVAMTMMRMKNQEELDDKIADLKNVIVNNNLTWIVNQKYVQMIESNSEETWAFTPELTYSVQEGTDIFYGVKENLSKGHKYKIFMPDRPRVHKMIADYQRVHDFKDGQVQFILIPNNEFFFHTVMVVYNINSAEPRCIEWLPVRELSIWIEMDQEHTNRMIGIGSILIKKYFPEEFSQIAKRIDADIKE